MLFFHYKKGQIGYNTARRFCGARLLQNKTQYKEISHESEAKPGDNLKMSNKNEQRDQEKHFKTRRL